MEYLSAALACRWRHWLVAITLAADHRVSDGHAGALFLAEIGGQLQEPDKL